MKICPYCGRGSQADAIHCQECGTLFEAPSTQKHATDGSTPLPPLWRLIAWTITAVEFPFLFTASIAFVPHGRHTDTLWSYWPVLPGLLFSLLVPIPYASRLPEWGRMTIAGMVTLGMIVLLVRWTHRSRHWSTVLVLACIFFCLLSALTYGMWAA